MESLKKERGSDLGDKTFFKEKKITFIVYLPHFLCMLQHHEITIWNLLRNFCLMGIVKLAGFSVHGNVYVCEHTCTWPLLSIFETLRVLEV